MNVRLLSLLLITVILLSACTPPAKNGHLHKPETKHTQHQRLQYLFPKGNPKDFQMIWVGPFGDALGLENLLLLASPKRKLHILFRDVTQSPSEYERLVGFLENPENQPDFLKQMLIPFYSNWLDDLSLTVLNNSCIMTTGEAFPAYILQIRVPNQKRVLYTLFTVIEYADVRYPGQTHLALLNAMPFHSQETRQMTPEQAQKQMPELARQLSKFIQQDLAFQAIKPPGESPVIRSLFYKPCKRTVRGYN